MPAKKAPELPVFIMSEQQPPESPRSQKTPQSKPEGGFNWKVIILFTVAIAIIMVAYKTAGPGDRKTLTLPEFREALMEGRVLQTASDDFKGGKLELVTVNPFIDFITLHVVSARGPVDARMYLEIFKLK